MSNDRQRTSGSTSNMSRPTRPARCTWAIAAERWSATALARLLEAAGFRVTKEYYVNDAGGQVDVLARSLHLRYREALGEDIGEIPEGLYPGRLSGARRRRARGGIWRPLRRRARRRLAAGSSASARSSAMLDLIRHDLALLGIHHDHFASEAELQHSGAVDEAMDVLRRKGLVYEGELERPKSLDPHDEWEPVELTLFRSSAVRRRPGPADEEVGRQLDLFRRRRRLSSRRRRKTPIIWSTSGAPTMPARSSASRRR